MNYLYIFLLFLFSIIFRSMIRIVYKKSIDYDTYYHLYFIDFIRNNGLSNLVEQKRFIRPFGLNYPWMMHFFISFFPKKFDIFLERFFNPILDSLFTVFLYCATFYITSSNTQALIVTILYLFTPAMFTTLLLGPRIKSFTPRLFGEIVGSMMFIFEYLYFINYNYIFLILAVVFSSFAYLSSKFSVQAIFFISVVLFIFTFQIEYIVVLIGGFTLSMVFSKGKYYAVLKQQIQHLKWYFIRNLQSKMAISDRNSIKALIKHIRHKQYRKLAGAIFFENTFIIVLTRFPLIYLAGYLILDTYQKNGHLSIVDYFLLASFVVFFISSLKWFLFIGEAERYFNYVVFFVLYKSVEFFEENLIYLYVYIIYGLLFYILDFVLLSKKEKNKNDENENFVNWLNSQSKALNIATIPYHLGGWRIVYDTQHNRLFSGGWIEKDKQELSMYEIKYPFLDINKADSIMEVYNLDYIFYNKNALEKNIGGKYFIPENLKQIQVSENIFALYK